MSKKTNPLCAFASSRESRKEEAKPALVPKLRFPEFRGAEGWTGEKLGPKAKKVGSGITPTGGEKNYKTSGRPFVRSQNIGWGELLLNDVAFIDEETHNSFRSTEIEALDVLLNITGASIGRSAVADSRIMGGNVNQHVCIIRVKSDELSPYFLNQYLISHDGQKQINSFQAGGNRQGLNFEQIRSFLLPLPAFFAEQQKIAECLSAVDEVIAAQARKVDALKTHKKWLMQQLFPREGETQPRLRLPELQNAAEREAKPALVPRLRFPEFRGAEGWTEKPLKAVAQMNPANDDLPESFIYINLESVEAGKLKAKNRISREAAPSRAQRVVEHGDIIFQVVRPYQRNNLLCEFQDDGDYVASTGYAQLRAKGSNHFLYQSIHTDSFVGRVMAKCTGSSYPAINSSDLAEIHLPLPPTLPEQQKIAECLSSVDELIAAQARKLDALKTHKKGLMQQLFPSPEELES